MLSRPTEARSIGSQLVRFFTVATAVILGVGLGVLYWIVVQHAYEEDNEALTDRLFAVRADLAHTGGVRLLNEELETPRPRERITYWVRVSDASGALLAETPGMKELLAPQNFPAAQDGALESFEPSVARIGGRLWALLVTRQVEDGRTYIIQLAQDRSVDEQFTKHFGILVIAVLVGGSLISAFIAVRLTRRGLRPLAEITRSLERTGPTQLHERVEPAAWPRELRPLAVAFDQMLDRLEDSFTRLSQFSADLAHELRTPVANLRGEAEVALTRTRTAGEYREVIESSVGEYERLSAIIDNLLFLARAEAAQGLAERTRFAGRLAIEKIAAYFQTIAEERRITITHEGNGEIYADALLFSRALSNLMENALRYTPDGGSIEIRLRAEPEVSTVSVHDSGSGIEPKHLSRIFDRFYRADSSRSSQGTGLGLALVKSIMDLHGGRAVAESQDGRGTTVQLVFPTGGKPPLSA
ncbi:MAG: heavy metal sensor histidine kinase [Chthoniobacterales bacterium]